MIRHLAGLGVVAAMAFAAVAQASTGVATVAVYPSAQTITASGSLPAGGSKRIALNAPVDGDVAAVVVVAGAKRVGVNLDRGTLGGFVVGLRFAHFVAFGSTKRPDALLPWNGAERAAEQRNQPLWVQVSVPTGTAPGTYAGTLNVIADGKPVAVPLSVKVFRVTLPPRGAIGTLVAALGIGPEAYVGKASSLYHFTSADGFAQFTKANASLFDFLASYGITPMSWGYANPKQTSGYESSSRWWLDSANTMESEVGGPRFNALWVPVPNNRAAGAIGGLSYSKPEGWCGYLRSVRNFWAGHGWLWSGVVPFVYGYDEPSTAQVSLIARQATAVHDCFAGAKVMVTATPSPDGDNATLFDRRGSDDVDIWSVAEWRYYGKYTTPSERKKRVDNSQYYTRAIAKAKASGKTIWTYTYAGVPVGPSLRAGEPLSDPRMFVLWAALEGITGIVYGQGSTTYGPGNPLDSVAKDGVMVLIYPGPDGPIPSARLEQLREGIEDWSLFDAVRRRYGAGKVRSILGAHGLFSARSSGVELACSTGCRLKDSDPHAWPVWSHDSSTASRIEAARADALAAASR